MELIEAQDWYENSATGLSLSRRFLQAVDVLVQRMAANPLQFPVVYRNARRALLRGFPYMLFFVIQDETSFVIACFHASRDPAQLQRRL
jgi:plasmid stabilization system protein ParE